VSGVSDPALQRDLDALAPPGLLIGHRLIAAGDERALRDAESASLTSRVPAARRASGAARIVARDLLARLGFPDAEVPKGVGGEPVWPTGVAGSLAHDNAVAVAAVGFQRDFASIGVDVEPALDLSADMLELVATPAELRRIDGDLLKARVLFAAKEAVYKAAYRLDHSFLEFTDIEVDLTAGRARTRTGHIISLRTCISCRIAVVAFITAAQA
jgi:4'-phosphopantetheinyl transferase EntD